MEELILSLILTISGVSSITCFCVAFKIIKSSDNDYYRRSKKSFAINTKTGRPVIKNVSSEDDLDRVLL